MVYVVVLTEFKEVFFGECNNPEADVLTLQNARQAVFYSVETHGLLGLAATGPAEGSKIGPPIVWMHIASKHVRNVLLCSNEAIQVWKQARWG